MQIGLIRVQRLELPWTLTVRVGLQIGPGEREIGTAKGPRLAQVGTQVGKPAIRTGMPVVDSSMKEEDRQLLLQACLHNQCQCLKRLLLRRVRLRLHFLTRMRVTPI